MIKEQNILNHLDNYTSKNNRHVFNGASNLNWSPRITALVIILLLTIAILSSWVNLTRTDFRMRAELLTQTKMITQAIDIEKVKTLSGTEKDLENPDYQRLKEQLTRIISANDKGHFIYLMGQKPDGAVFFLVDNELPDSEDYSAPGDLFEDASDELTDVFITGQPLVEGPIADQWGVWVSAIVPLYDPQDNEVIAILGIDYDAATWRRDLATRAALPVGMTMSTFLLLSLLIMLLRNHNLIQQSRIEMHELKVFNETIVQKADEGIIVTDSSGIITFANPALEKMLGCSTGELNGQSWIDFVPPAMRERAIKADQARAKGQSERYELQLQHKDGTPVPVQISASPRYDSLTGTYTGTQAVMTNIANIQQAERAIRENEEKYRLIFERSPFGILHFDNQGVITDCNEKFVEIIGSSYEVLLGLDMTRLPDQNIVKAVQSALQGETATYEDTYRSVTAEKVTPVRAIFAPIISAGNSYGTAEGGIGIIEDITDRKLAEEKVRHMSYNDQLTDLYNRYYMEEELKRLDTERQLPFSIIMADVNGLKLVNDTYGHLVGDQLLCKAADIIRENSRSEDIVARWGGDEFVILLPQTPEIVANKIAKRISDSCKSVQVEDFPVSIALGSATRKRFSKTLTATLKEAEDKMYEQKLTESRSTKSAVLGTLLKTLAAKSYETEAHTRNMQETALNIGKRLGLPDSELNRLVLLITLHDIGKINIPEELLIKQQALTAQEWEVMKKHPETGYRIAMATEEFAHVAEDILSHHEKFDGSGYPRGLKDQDIPLLARITAVADAYEVMSNGRPYKKAMPTEAIIAEFIKCSGTHFDPDLVNILLSFLTL